MSENEKTITLNDREISDLQRKVREKLGDCRKTNDVIGDQIFSILSLYTRVIYYPLGADSPWGFTRVTGINAEVSVQKPFVVINTSIPRDCQIFAAAHELYHIWFKYNADVVLPNVLEDISGTDELKANRFAAEFLVDQNLLEQEMKMYSITNARITVKDILKLADLFTVPYRTMVKRMREIKAIDEKTETELLSKKDTEVRKLRKRFALSIPEADNRIGINNMIDLSAAVYEKKLITYEKLEALLSLSKLTPDDVGIAKPESNDFPTIQELDEIMGD